ncbi:MAG: hypothetical protein JOY65_08605, partial [Acetobacteraceae bacterium]|nr:hypothetical protein [Acetobacteraceae bacterium]
AGARWESKHYAGLPPGAGREPRFLLYAADVERGAALTARFPMLLEPEPRTPPDASTLFIVRPDGYVGLSAHGASWGEAESYLEALTLG